MSKNLNKECFHSDSNLEEGFHFQKNEKKVQAVLYLTLFTMVLEIIAGVTTGSMALLADGWHMGSHAGALFVTFVSYRLARSKKIKTYLNFGGGKFLPLGAYSNALLLGVVALFMIFESVERLIWPQKILYNEALWVAVFGLGINIICAYILRDESHHNHGHAHDEVGTSEHHIHASKDINLHGAYIHVIADALTSILAIFALWVGKKYSLTFLDSFAGLLGAYLILKWSSGLLKQSAIELLDGYVEDLHPDKIKIHLSEKDFQVIDLHVWKVAPGKHHCELVVATKVGKGVDYYKGLIQAKFPIQHIVVEERIQSSF